MGFRRNLTSQKDGVCTVTPGIMDVHLPFIDFVQFRVYDSGAMPKNNPWLGVVRPRLAWDTSFLDEVSTAKIAATGDA